MKKITLTDSYLQESLKQARYYEFCKEPEKALAVLKPIWKSIEVEPEIENLTTRQTWEVLRVCGSLLSVYGTIKQAKNYGEAGINMLTRAREAAIEIGERDLIAESEKQMAVAYWRLGEFENAIAFLNTCLSKYSEAEKLTNRICLLAQANLLWLIYKVGQPETALETLVRIMPFVEESDDLWLKTHFYNQAAGVYIFTGNYKAAIPMLEKSVEYSILTKNNTYLGFNLNNLATAYLNLSVPDPVTAMKHIDEAINMFMATNQTYPYAVALETKAQLMLDAGNPKKALLLVDESIGILEKGENYSQLCDSLWTRTRILVNQREIKQAIRQFNSLLFIANEKLSLLAGDEFVEQFSKILYLPTGASLEEKEKDFRRYLLDNALRSCGGIVTTTANRLGLMHQTLSAMLKKFPDLCRKHQVKLRTRTLSGGLSSGKSKAEPGEKATFAMKLLTDRLAYLGLKKGMIVEARRRVLSELDLLQPVIIKDTDNKFHCGFLVNAFEMLAFEDGRGEIERTFLQSDIADAGQVVGVYDERSGNFIPLGNL